MMIIAFISYFIISLPVGYFCGFVLGWGLSGSLDGFPVRADQRRADAMAALPV